MQMLTHEKSQSHLYSTKESIRMERNLSMLNSLDSSKRIPAKSLRIKIQEKEDNIKYE